MTDVSNSEREMKPNPTCPCGCGQPMRREHSPGCRCTCCERVRAADEAIAETREPFVNPADREDEPAGLMRFTCTCPRAIGLHDPRACESNRQQERTTERTPEAPETYTDAEAAPMQGSTTNNAAHEHAVDEALHAVRMERGNQHLQWGDQSQHPDTTWLAILTEEVGEAAQACLHNGFGGKARGTLRDELVQVAAVAVAWIEAIDTRGQDYV